MRRLPCIKNLIITDSRGLKFIDEKKYDIINIQSSHLNNKNLKLFISILKLLIGFIQFKILIIQKIIYTYFKCFDIKKNIKD